MALHPEDLFLIQVNSDLYGMGIRLGIYLQLISSLLANCLLPEQMLDAWGTNSIFVLAVFVAVIKTTIDHTVQYVEVFVMLQLMFAFLLSVFPTHYRISWFWLSLQTVFWKRKCKWWKCISASLDLEALARRALDGDCLL